MLEILLEMFKKNKIKSCKFLNKLYIEKDPINVCKLKFNVLDLKEVV